MANFLGTLIKWLFYAALLGLGGYLLWRYRDQVRSAILGFLEELRAWWRQWFTRDSAAANGDQDQSLNRELPRPFSDFANPYRDGSGSGWTSPQLIRHTFEALEAWAREQGCPREADQTPHEFVRSLGKRIPQVAQPAATLADLYCRLAYAPADRALDGAAALRRLWDVMQAGAAVPAGNSS